MKRREFIAVTAALLVSPRHVQAQGKPRRIGYLGGFEFPPTLRSGIGEKGWIEGKNLIVDYRYFEGHNERLPALAAELVALNPDLLICSTGQAAIALKSATATIPIIFVGINNPVALGLVQSLSHPGGNITGLTSFVPGDFVAKQIQMLRELVPRASKIAILANPGNPMHVLSLVEEVPRAARNLGIAMPVVEATTAEQLDIAFASAAGQRADAIIVFGDTMVLRQASRVVALAAEHRLPAMYLFGQFTNVGGLISYGPDLPDLFHRAGGYVDNILKGTKPADLSVEQPTKFELVINMKTAKALGLTVPALVTRPRRQCDRIAAARMTPRP
jgi:putative tryptophan/tyrosine transport system substrate-binding protein